jgi:hypothetical protein
VVDLDKTVFSDPTVTWGMPPSVPRGAHAAHDSIK